MLSKIEEDQLLGHCCVAQALQSEQTLDPYVGRHRCAEETSIVGPGALLHVEEQHSSVQSLAGHAVGTPVGSISLAQN